MVFLWCCCCCLLLTSIGKSFHTCFLSAQMPQSSAAVPASSQWNGFHWNRNSVHFTIVLPEKCCFENQPLCVGAYAELKNVAASSNCYLIFFLVTLIHRWNVYFLLLILYSFPSSLWPDPRAVLSDTERPRGCLVTKTAQFMLFYQILLLVLTVPCFSTLAATCKACDCD